MAENIEQLVAIDLGNGYTSYMSGTGERNGGFASLVTDSRSSQGLGGSFSREVFKTKSGSYYVGDECREDGAVSRSTDSAFYKSDAIRVLLLRVLKEFGHKQPIIVTGLPTEFFHSHRDDFAKDIRRWATDEGYPPAKVQILPQYVGPWFDPELKTISGKTIEPAAVMQGKWGIIDIGHGTIDAGQFVNGQVSSHADHRYGESKGVSDIHKSLFTALQNPEELNQKLAAKQRLPKEFTLDAQTTEYTMDTWLRQGYIPWRGDRIDIGPISMPARQAFADDVIPRVIKNIWGSTDFLTGIIFAGGGATVLGAELLQKHVRAPIYLADDPWNSIVRGMRRFYVTQNFKEHAKLRTERV